MGSMVVVLTLKFKAASARAFILISHISLRVLAFVGDWTETTWPEDFPIFRFLLLTTWAGGRNLDKD